MNVFGVRFDFEARMNKVKTMMEERDIDCLFVHRWTNQYYIAGVVQHLPWYPDVTVLTANGVELMSGLPRELI